MKKISTSKVCCNMNTEDEFTPRRIRSKERIPYIDSLKGLAILLVVMGHVLACYHNDFNQALSVDSNSMILWKFIYGFHMPLFLFLSGFVFNISSIQISFSNVFFKIKKNFKRLIVPYVSMGVVYFVLLGNTDGYWYLYVLFIFCTIISLLNWLLGRFKWWNSSTGSIVLLCVSFIAKYFLCKLHPYEILPIFDWGHFALFFYFCLGIVFRKHKLDLYIQRNAFVYNLLLISFFISFLSKFRIGFSFPDKLDVYAISATIIIFILFSKVRQDCTNVVLRFLNEIGKKTLEIYLLHFFFLAKIPLFGSFLDSIDSKISIILQLLSSTFCALLIIGLNCLICKIVEPADVVRKLFFGK